MNCPDLINEYMKSVERQQALMVAKGRMIEPPKRVVRAYRDEDDKIVYEVKYSDGRTEDMPSGDLIKLSPPVMIAFLGLPLRLSTWPTSAKRSGSLG